MSKALMNDVLLQAVGSKVMSKDEEAIGEIIEVTRSTKTHLIDYLILKNHHSDGKTHFFAIPASKRFITISDTFTIYFQYPKEDIFFAKKVKTDQCPAPNLRYGKSIFELDDYHSPKQRKTPYLTSLA